MSNIKIYLSKSNSGKIEDLMKVRSFLSKYSNVEIVEFSGGKYNNDDLDSSDVVLVIPPILPKPYTFDFTVGKGQFEQYSRAIQSKTLLFVICIGDELYVSNFSSDNLLDVDWKLNYAKVFCSETMVPIQNALSWDFNLETININKFHLACYHLIKK